MSPRVLVSHPHAAPFATGAAQGFARRGALARYVSGVLAAEGTPQAWLARAIGQRRPALVNRIVRGLRGGDIESLLPVELGARLLGRASERAGLRRVRAYDWLFGAHDAAVAALPWPADVTAIYAYEDGARWTFERARRRGLARIWDLPLPHWATLETLWREESARWPGAMGASPPVEPAWKKARKEAELARADVVSVASRFTKESLERLGVSAPITVTPYGFPTEDFAPRASAPAGRFTVLAVGTHDLRKGTPYLLEAWKKAELRDARLCLIGGMRLRPEWLAPYAGLFEHVPHRAKSDLAAEYQKADLLAFPTLGDGFGIVMQEAMCCATPVLTTRCGGGPECITSGEDGLLVPEARVDALVEALRWAASHRDTLVEMGRRARARAERWTWEHAGDALAERVLAALPPNR